MQEYTKRFTEKERFATHQVATEQRKVHLFIEGLRVDIKRYIEMTIPKTFLQAVEVAKIAEKSSDRPTEVEMDGKRKWGGSSKGSKIAKLGSGSKPKGSGVNYLLCSKCNRRHSGECKIGRKRCYMRGKLGHN